MSESSKPGGKLVAAVVVVAVPLALGALLLFVRGGDAGSGGVSSGATARTDLSPLETWPDGKPRVLSREWSEQGLAYEEQCFLSESGQELGCGVRRDGKPWEGTFVEWHDALDGTSHLKEIGNWRAGREHGLWRSFNPDGSPLIEARYEDGRFVSREIVGKRGNPIIEVGARKNQAPPSRRTRSTGQ